MPALRRSHRFVRLLAVWLLLWFVVMALPQPLRLAQRAEPCPAGAGVAALAEGGDAPSRHAAHGDHADHAPACEHAQPDLHAGHGAGAVPHCPLCLHAAAPPQVLLGPALPGVAPQDRTWAPPRLDPRVRSDAPPPARGPPRHS